MRYPFGGDGSAAFLDLTTGGLLVDASDGVVYSARTGGSPLADITSDQAGTTFLDNVTTDSNGIPNLFYGPDGVTQVYVQFGTMARFRLDSFAALKTAMDLPGTIGDLQGDVENALTTDDLATPGGPAKLDSTGRLPYGQLPADIQGGPGANIDSLVVNGKSPSGGNLSLTPEDLGAAPATGIPVSSIDGLKTVAVTAKYSDLTGTPTLGKVSSSNAYADLDGRPVLPAITRQREYIPQVGAAYPAKSPGVLYADYQGTANPDTAAPAADKRDGDDWVDPTGQFVL